MNRLTVEVREENDANGDDLKIFPTPPPPPPFSDHSFLFFFFSPGTLTHTPLCHHWVCAGTMLEVNRPLSALNA